MNLSKFLSRSIVVTLFIVIAVSCRKDSAVGPAGPAGASGTQLLKYKQGKISGDVECYNRSNQQVSFSFDYQYYDDVIENSFYRPFETSYYDYIITRYDSIGESFITLKFRMEPDNEEESGVLISNQSVKARFIKKEANGDFFYLATGGGGYGSTPQEIDLMYDYSNTEGTIEVLDIEYTESNGQASFDYTIQLNGNYNSTGNAATITGSINVSPVGASMRTTQE